MVLREVTILFPLVLAVFGIAIADAQIYGYYVVEERDMWIVVAFVNSPWNGEALYSRETYFEWQFGSIITAYQEVILDSVISASDGQNAMLAQYAHVVVYEDIFGRRWAEVKQLYRYYFGQKYESPGDMYDDICYGVASVVNDQVVAVHMVCPIYEEMDELHMYCNGFEHTVSITYDSGVEYSVDMSLSLGTASLSGIMKGHIISGSTEKVTYHYKAPLDSCAEWRVDYLGVYGPNAPPTIQAAFYTVVSSSNTLATSTKMSVASNGGISKIDSSGTSRVIKVELVAIEPDGKPVGRIITYKYKDVADNEASVEKRLKVMGSFSLQGDKYVITPITKPEYDSRLEYVRLYVWRITTNGSFVEEGPQSWGRPILILTLNKLMPVILVKTDDRALTKIVIEAVFADGKRDYHVVVINGYTLPDLAG